jgi:NADH-quinone oxidoreductase subunit M
VLAALYILLMYQRTMTGPVRDGIEKLKDLNVREVLAIAPLMILIVGLGIFPRPLVDIIKPAVETTMQQLGVTDKAPQIPVTEGQK